jgi:DNA mismatch endonuclease, patch repair protein
MADVLTPEQRSNCMSHVRGKDTTPEMTVRSLLHRLGYRFRLHCKHLPGKRDIVLPAYRSVIFVHGCFWHDHLGCKRAGRPASNREFWNTKIDKNVERDRAVQTRLKDLGWRVMVLWQCEIADTRLNARLNRFLRRKVPTQRSEHSNPSRLLA